MHGKSEFSEEFNEVSMTVVLVGFAHNGFAEEAIQILVKTVMAGIEVGWFGVDTSLGLIHMLLANNRIKQNMDRGLKFPLEEMHVVWYHAARDDDTRAAH